eukprot:3135511-Rhodomonas_salina.1
MDGGGGGLQEEKGGSGGEVDGQEDELKSQDDLLLQELKKQIEELKIEVLSPRIMSHFPLCNLWPAQPLSCPTLTHGDVATRKKQRKGRCMSGGKSFGRGRDDARQRRTMRGRKCGWRASTAFVGAT